ncbi:MAG: hypothetical protein JXB00_00565 [Bacteroidales bacterium]|nr:hypothetical protein [Bacteroidales bacterium]
MITLDTYIKGVGNPTIDKLSIRSIHVNICTLEEQELVVREIESRLSVCDNIQLTVDEALTKSEALRQSILKKAFEGKLLNKQELEACKTQADWEPAEKLLERIKKEKTVTSKTDSVQPDVKPEKISTDKQAGVIAKIIKLHNENPEHLDKLNHVKCEKIVHLVEYHLHIPLGRKPVKDAAGPDDYRHLKKVEHRAKMAGYFRVKKLNIGHTYLASRNISKAVSRLEQDLNKNQIQKLNNLLKLFLKLELEQAEIVATLYAAWNNLLIDNKKPTDEEIVYEARENWSKRKLRIKRERFFKALKWMEKKDVNLIPTGYGQKVLKKKKAGTKK